MSKLQIFISDDLNRLGQELIQLEEEYRSLRGQAEDIITSAFKRRWLHGKKISENIEKIKEECGTQKAFADKLGKSEAWISNNKRAYEDLLANGAETWEQVVKLVKENKIPLNSRSFEKIGTLLNEPQEDTKQIDQIDKDRKRLEQLKAEADEILRRLEPANKPTVLEDAFEVKEDIQDIQDYVASFDIERSTWRSEKYLNFVRNFGIDLITMEPCENCDAHHTTATGGAGTMGGKLADFYVIPVSRLTHTMIESGLLVPSKEEIMKAHFTVMATFISMNLSP